MTWTASGGCASIPRWNRTCDPRSGGDAGAPWPSRTQVEQDLLLSRLICEIANDGYLSSELVFRGGTCFHKLHIHPARRYSEDLDYVRSTAGGIKEFTQAVTAIGDNLGFEVKTKVGVNPKVYLLTESVEGLRIRIKVEVNTRERSPADPVQMVPYQVASSWWSGHAEVRTLSTRELVATKIRALYERKKSRDVFDMWLAFTELGLTGEDVLGAFEPYHPASLTAKTAIMNLRDKLADNQFRTDLDPFLAEPPPGYNLDEAARLLIDEVLSKIPKPPAAWSARHDRAGTAVVPVRPTGIELYRDQFDQARKNDPTIAGSEEASRAGGADNALTIRAWTGRPR